MWNCSIGMRCHCPLCPPARQVVMYWTDTRLIGWTGKLPSNLWGPYYDSAAGGSTLRSV